MYSVSLARTRVLANVPLICPIEKNLFHFLSIQLYRPSRAALMRRGLGRTISIEIQREDRCIEDSSALAPRLISLRYVARPELGILVALVRGECSLCSFLTSRN